MGAEKEVQEPDLRFPKFARKWKSGELSKLLKVKHGFAFKGEFFGDSGEFVVVTPGNFNPDGGFRYQGKKEKYYQSTDFPKEYILEEGDILTAMTEQADGLIGSTIEIPESNKFLHNQRLGLFLIKESVDRKFIGYLFQKSTVRNKLSRLSAGTKVRHISPQKIESMGVSYPSFDEQQRISSFLSSIDEKLTKLRRKRELLETYKRGIMQKIFSQELRFKKKGGGDYPDWEEVPLGDISTPIKRTAGNPNLPVMTISAGRGFLDQTERFSQVIAGSSLEKYTHIKRGEFAYNRGASKAYPYGCIYLMQNHDGALIPFVYRTFKLHDVHEEFYYHYFLDHKLDRQLRRVISSSARMDGLLNIGEKDFYTVKVPKPHIKEQEKIAGFISSIDKKIDEVSSQTTQLETFKKALLQKMFI